MKNKLLVFVNSFTILMFLYTFNLVKNYSSLLNLSNTLQSFNLTNVPSKSKNILIIILSTLFPACTLIITH